MISSIVLHAAAVQTSFLGRGVGLDAAGTGQEMVEQFQSLVDQIGVRRKVFALKVVLVVSRF